MRLQMEIDGQSRQVQIEAAEAPGLWNVRVDGEIVEADARLLRPGVLSLLIDGRSHRVVLDGDSSDPALLLDGQRIPCRVEDPRSLRSRRRHPGADAPVVLKASMPGRVVRVLVEKGQEVAAHQPVVVIEAMKMQNELKSPREGRVADLRAIPGATVASGETLAVIE
ncbi:MAG TPA: biotin/lipoyl-containing protein [Acidobacteriaceae bacterium]|nr:biotin/lipoyl-containing protein [Acidobacteriaceae bacterium]